MKIGIVLHPYGEKKPGGLARTIFEWTGAMLRIDQKNAYTIFLKEEPKEAPQFSGKTWKYQVLGSGLLWRERLKKTSEEDWYIFQTPVLPFFLSGKKSVIIVQDFPYRYLASNNAKEWIRNKALDWYYGISLRRAALVVAVSEYAKNDVMRFFHVPEQNIKVIPMGYKNVCETTEEKVEIPNKFFLSVGVMKERKNTKRIAEAFAEFKKKHPSDEHKMVFAGKAEGKYAEAVKAILKKENLESQAVFLDHLRDGQLSYVYRRATALVFPSVVESFGFPVLEGMACGIPVITSNTGGPSEIGREAAILVDPMSTLSICEAMEKIAFDENVRKKIIEAGNKRKMVFSWEKAAKALIESLEEIKR